MSNKMSWLIGGFLLLIIVAVSWPSEDGQLNNAANQAHLVALADKHPEPVVMLTTAWCPECRRARDYLKTAGIAFVDYDIEKTAFGGKVYGQLKGRYVPLIVTRGKTDDGKADVRAMYGLNIPELTKRLAHP